MLKLKAFARLKGGGSKSILVATNISEISKIKESDIKAMSETTSQLISSETGKEVCELIMFLL